MANIKGLAERRTVFRCSGSIANFYPKLKSYLKLDDWHWWQNRSDQVIFFGLYHKKDYLRFLWHRGPKKVLWCGSDILTLPRWWAYLISKRGTHYCENWVECLALFNKGIDAGIIPTLFDDPDKYPISYKWSGKPNVYTNCHRGREQEYGINKICDLAHQFPEINFHIYGITKPEIWFDSSINEMRNLYYDLPNLIYHGVVSNQQFNEEVKSYQGCIRLNKFDGFAETVAKSLLMGQYVISEIDYPYTFSILKFPEIFEKEPNIEASDFWRQMFKANMEELVNNWR